MKNYSVRNKTNRTVYTEGRIFPPLDTVFLNLRETQRFRLSVHKDLEVKETKKEKDNLKENKEETYACKYCGKEYKTLTGLKKHIEKEHEEVIEDESEK